MSWHREREAGHVSTVTKQRQVPMLSSWPPCSLGQDHSHELVTLHSEHVFPPELNLSGEALKDMLSDVILNPTKWTMQMQRSVVPADATRSTLPLTL